MAQFTWFAMDFWNISNCTAECVISLSMLGIKLFALGIKLFVRTYSIIKLNEGLQGPTAE